VIAWLASGLEDFILCRLHDLLDKISGQMEIFQA
jgi:hypothetical protein